MSYVAKRGVSYGSGVRSWKLMDGSVCFGDMVEYVFGGFTSVSVISQHTGLHLSSKIIKGTGSEQRRQALEWARSTYSGEPVPTVERLERQIASLKESRYRDEMSDDYAYSNGKIAYWNDAISRLEVLLDRIKNG